MPNVSSLASYTMLEPISASLKALQSQLTTFQESLGGVQSDVRDALSQLHALRDAQIKTDKSIADLESMIDVSSTSGRLNGRRKRSRGRGRGSQTGAHTEAPLEVDGAGAGNVPEKTLVQSVASIQSAVEALLSRDGRAPPHLPMHHREGVSPLFVSQFAELASFRTSQSSPLPSVVNPSQQHATSQSTMAQFASTASSTPQSGPSSHLYPTVIPIPEFGASWPPAAPIKEYTDTAIQACPPSPTFEVWRSLSSSHEHAPGLISDDSNVDSAMVGKFASDSIQPTFIAGYQAHLPREAHLPGVSNSMTGTQAFQGDGNHLPHSSGASYTQSFTRATSASALSSYPSERSSGTQLANSTLPPAIPSSLDATLPSASGTSPTRKIPPPPAGASIQSFEWPQILFTKKILAHTTPPQVGPPGDSQARLTSPLNSLTGTCITPVSVSSPSRSEEHVGYSGPPNGELDPEGTQTSADTEGDAILVAGRVKTAPGSTTSAPWIRPKSPSVVTDGEGLTSGLPTPPSDADTDHELQLGGLSTHEHYAATDLKLISCTHLVRSLPVISTPPFLAPKRSMGEVRAMLPGTDQGSVRLSSLGPFSPLTPPMFSPSSGVGNSHAEEGGSNVSQQVVAHKIVVDHTDFPDDIGGVVVDGSEAAEVVGVDASIDVGSSLRTDRACVDESTSAISVKTLISESRSAAVSNQDSSQVRWMTEDVDRISRSSVNQPNIDFPERGSCVNDIDPPYSPTNTPGYDAHFLSSHHRPESPTSATTSRYTTPGTSGSQPTQDRDENEVWHTLILHGSGISTPMSGFPSLPVTFSDEASRASSVRPRPVSSQPLSIDSSMLHDLPLLPPVSGLSSSPPALDRSLSPLTSLGDTDIDKNNDANAALCEKTLYISQSKRNSRNTYKERRSEPYRAISRSTPSAMGMSMPVVGAVPSPQMGGPSASLEQLALLARREPLKIYLRLPATMRGVKRKRVADVDEGEGEGQGEGTGRVDGDINNTRRHLWGGNMFVDEDGQTGERESTENVPRTRIEVTSAHGTCTPASIVSYCAPESSSSNSLVVDTVELADVTPGVPVPRERKRRISERTEKEKTKKETQQRHSKRKRILKVKPKSPVTYHIRNGEIVTIPSEPGLRSQAPGTLPEESGQDGRTPAEICRPSRRKGQENRAIKTEVSSGHRRQPSSRSVQLVKSSSTKEDVCNTNSQCGATWPELPDTFNHWDVQFILCDSCDKWYHYGCVAIKSGDPRLEPGVLFICSACHTQSASRQTLPNQSDTCARPDCPDSQATQDTEFYFVERLVGRKRIEGYIYMWLAKWEGYPMSQATWIPKENVVGDGTRLFSAFLKDAVEEGADLSQDVVLLQEALEAGWET